MVGKDLIMATLLGSGGGIPQEDIDAAFAALAEKGVTVPDGATSADLDELIKSIAAGGIEGYSTVQGTFTVSEDVTSGYHEIKCKFTTTKPTYMYSLVYMVDGHPDAKDTKHLIAAVGSTYFSYSGYSRTGVYLYAVGSSGGVNASTTGNSYMVMHNANVLSIDLYTSDAPLRAGVTYGWVFLYK